MSTETSDEEMDHRPPDLADIQSQIEHDASIIRAKLKNIDLGSLDSTAGSSKDEWLGEDDESEVGELESIMEDFDCDDDGHTLQTILTIPGRDPIGPPEWGDDLTARILQEQNNARLLEENRNTSSPVELQSRQPPTGPVSHIMIPVTQSTFMKIFDGMERSRAARSEDLYPEPAFAGDIGQFVLTNGCPWLDRNLWRITQHENITLARNVTSPAPDGEHFLIAILRPEYHSRWRMLNPLSDAGTTSDTVADWTTLDDPTPRRSLPTVSDKSQSSSPDRELPQPNDRNQLPCQVSMDVDSVLILSDKLPLCQPIEVRAIPAKSDTVQYSNKLYMKAGAGSDRVLLSKVPNCRFGRAGRTTVNLFFPRLFDPTNQGPKSAMLSNDQAAMIWDRMILPAVQSVFPKGIDNIFLESYAFERERHSEQWNKDGQSSRASTIPSDLIPRLVRRMRDLVEETTDSDLELLRGFKFLVSFQGFKLFSFTPYDDFTFSENTWFNSLDLSDKYIRQLMFYKAYLKGLRRVTNGVLIPQWLDFNGLLQEGITRYRRLAEWDICQDEDDNFLEQPLPGDDVDAAQNKDRSRLGPSLMLVPDLTDLCDGEGCDSCQVFLDTAVEVGCAGKVSVWNHDHCFDVVKSLLGRNGFDQAHWQRGLRIDEVATMPGLGGVGFTDKLKPPAAVNSATPYIQLYCQEKGPTYAAFGNKPRGSSNYDAIPARSISLGAMLDCSGDPNSRLETWIGAESRILQHPTVSRGRSFPVRLEIRTSLESLADTSWNVVLALGRVFKSQGVTHALRHFDKDDWFRWKAVRAEHLARFPSAVFGKPHLNPSDWTIVHSLLVAQGLIHGLHSRASELTVERDMLNLHTSYLKVEEHDDGAVSYVPVTTILSLQDRARGMVYRAAFPAGVRTLTGWFDPDTGLDPDAFFRLHVALSSAEILWKKKVKRGVGCQSATTIDKLKEKIIFPKRIKPAGGTTTQHKSSLYQKRERASGPNFDEWLCKDKGFMQMEATLAQKIEQCTSGDIVMSRLEQQSFDEYMEANSDWDGPYLVLRFWRTLGLAAYKEEAVRFQQLRFCFENEGRELFLDRNGLLQLHVEQSKTGTGRASMSQAPRVPPKESTRTSGGLDPYQFEANQKRRTPASKGPTRRLEILWEIELDAHSNSLRLPGLRVPDSMKGRILPSPISEDDKADDQAFQTWLRRVAPPGYTPNTDGSMTPILSDYVVFVFATFQRQLLEAIPLQVGPNKAFPHHEGDPIVANLPEDALRVTQNLMRESYVGLPGRLSRFVITQNTVTQWGNKSAMFFPATLDDCLLHPGWVYTGATYLDYWRRLLERLDRYAEEDNVMGDLWVMSDGFIQSFLVLPDHESKLYNRIRQGITGHPLPFWDVTPFQKSPTAGLNTFDPRWMTRHKDGRMVQRIRIAYTVASPFQTTYLHRWQENLLIKETSPNYSRHHPPRHRLSILGSYAITVKSFPKGVI